MTLGVQVHGMAEKVCLSVLHTQRVTHHIMTKNARTGEYSVNTFPFTANATLLGGCTSIDAVLANLRQPSDYWKAPLTTGLEPPEGAAASSASSQATNVVGFEASNIINPSSLISATTTPCVQSHM